MFDRDVEHLVVLLGGDLSAPYQFIRLAGAMEELGRDEDVLTWALRGIAETNGWQVAQRHDLAAGVYTRRGAGHELLLLRREQHGRMPSSTTYGLLRAAAEPAGEWETQRSEARSVLAARDSGALVDVLIADGEPDVAWEVTIDNPDWDPGPQRLFRLAEAWETTSPADALGVYLRLADRALESTGRAGYTRAVKVLGRARRAAMAADQLEEFRQHVGSLRERNRRRPTFIAVLDKAALI